MHKGPNLVPDINLEERVYGIALRWQTNPL